MSSAPERRVFLSLERQALLAEICCAGIHFWITGDDTGIIRLQKDAFGARELCLSAFSQGEV